MIQEFHWSRAGAAAAFSVGSLVQAILAPVGGMLIDRWGARLVVVSGLGSMAIGLAACSRVQALWHLTLLFGVVVGLGVGLAGQVTQRGAASRVVYQAPWYHHRLCFCRYGARGAGHEPAGAASHSPHRLAADLRGAGTGNGGVCWHRASD